MIPQYVKDEIDKRNQKFDLENHKIGFLGNDESEKGIEDDFQKRCFEWFSQMFLETFDPRWFMSFSVPNGAMMGGNPKQRMINAVKFKACGLKPGVLDIVTPVQAHGFAGLFTELKVKNNKPSEEQIYWCKLLTWQGYNCQIVNSFEAFQDLYLWYFSRE